VFATRFFGPDAVAGVGRQQGFYDRLLCRVVDFGDEVIGFFLGDTRTDSMSSAARLMMEPAARAALTATLIMGCRLGDIDFSVKNCENAR
jgi:hypothetical protein